MGSAGTHSVEAGADSFVRLKEIGEPGDYGTRDRLAIKSDNPEGNNDRLAVLRFDLDAASEGDPVTDAAVTLHVAQPGDAPVRYELYGVLPAGAGG